MLRARAVLASTIAVVVCCLLLLLIHISSLVQNIHGGPAGITKTGHTRRRERKIKQQHGSYASCDNRLHPEGSYVPLTQKSENRVHKLTTSEETVAKTRYQKTTENRRLPTPAINTGGLPVSHSLDTRSIVLYWNTSTLPSFTSRAIVNLFLGPLYTPCLR